MMEAPTRPTGAPAMRMQWRSLLFAHWRAPVEMVRPLVPQSLEIDTFEGEAWVGLVPFAMHGVRPRWAPPIPTMHHFLECNVRTYVKHDEQCGVWFFSLDASSRLAVWGARRFWRLNYQFARMSLDQDGDLVRYNVDRVSNHPHPSAAGAPREAARGEPRLQCAWRIGKPLPRSQPGELAYFLTERYALYTLNKQGDLMHSRIWHNPWPLRQAEVVELDDTLVAAAGVNAPDEPPIAWCADDLDVEAWDLELA